MCTDQPTLHQHNNLTQDQCRSYLSISTHHAPPVGELNPNIQPCNLVIPPSKEIPQHALPQISVTLSTTTSPAIPSTPPQTPPRIDKPAEETSKPASTSPHLPFPITSTSFSPHPHKPSLSITNRSPTPVETIPDDIARLNVLRLNRNSAWRIDPLLLRP